MVTAEERSIITLTTEGLLGRPLNDVEKKFSPEKIYVKGAIPIPLPRPRVSIVGSRKASSQGLQDTATIAKTLAEMEVIIVSGLAEGIDTSAHKATIAAGGRTIGVLGTPLNKTYPLKNLRLQQEIMYNHLAISQFPIGYQTKPNSFVLRNRTMALISDATIIVEAEDTSGSRHQGWEALRLGRSLFIWKSILNNTRLTWPHEMIKYGAIVLINPLDILESLPSSFRMVNNMFHK